MKFTFKTEKATGKYKSFQPDHHYIKLRKVEVGYISDYYPHKIHLQVENLDGPGPWRWCVLKADFKDIKEAKDFLNQNINVILKTFKLYIEEKK